MCGGQGAVAPARVGPAVRRMVHERPRHIGMMGMLLLAAPVTCCSLLQPACSPVIAHGHRSAATRRVRGAVAVATEDHQRVFEVCHLNAANEIEECEVLYEHGLKEALGVKGAAQVVNDPEASELFFSVPAATAEEVGLPVPDEPPQISDDRVLISEADVQPSIDAGEPVPDDVLLRTLGPDRFAALRREDGEDGVGEDGGVATPVIPAADTPHSATRPAATADGVDATGPEAPRQAESRFHVHFGAGRLGMGLVVPAVAASGIPFAVVQRPKPKWRSQWQRAAECALDAGADGSKCAKLDLTVNGQVVVHGMDVISAAADGGERLTAAGRKKGQREAAAEDEEMPEFMPPQSLVFGSTAEELGGVVCKASSFSCSLGAAMSKVLLRPLSLLPCHPAALLSC